MKNTNPIIPVVSPGFAQVSFSSGMSSGLIDFIWPVFLMLILVIALLGLLTGIREGWNIGDSFYYAFITAFTIGYGDFSPSYPLTKIIAIVIGLFGFLFTGVLVAIAVESVRYTIQGKIPLKRIEK